MLLFACETRNYTALCSQNSPYCGFAVMTDIPASSFKTSFFAKSELHCDNPLCQNLHLPVISNISNSPNWAASF